MPSQDALARTTNSLTPWSKTGKVSNLSWWGQNLSFPLIILLGELLKLPTLARLHSNTCMNYLKQLCVPYQERRANKLPPIGRNGEGSEVKASAHNVGDLGLIPGSGRFPWKRKWQPTPVFLSGESHGQRSLVGYSPQGHKDSDTTERLHLLSF